MNRFLVAGGQLRYAYFLTLETGDSWENSPLLGIKFVCIICWLFLGRENIELL